MNIGIDIDNTITNTREVILEYIGRFASENDLNGQITWGRYSLEESLSWNSQQISQFLQIYLNDIYHEVSPRPYALEVIEELHRCHSITLITSRNQRDPHIQAVTLDWLNRYHLTYDKLVMNQTENLHHFSKLEACLNNHIHLMIEDHHDLSLELSSIIPVLMFDYPYNAHLEVSNIIRVRDWLEVKDYINSLSNS